MSEGDRPAALDALVAVAVRLAAAERLAPATAEPALRAIADAGAAALHVAAASIALHDPATNRLVFRAAAGPHGEGVIGVAIAPHEGIAGYVFSTGQPLALADVATDPRFERGTAERTGYVPRSLLAVPLVDAEGIVGVMEWLDRIDGAPFDLTDLEVATRVAAAATATARATRLDHDAAGLLRRALAATATEADPTSPMDAEAVVTAATADLAAGDALWRLADRIGRLRDADPDDLDLAVAWLDALLARTQRRGRAARRSA
jgi:signal transduction protein with GAF and PtsI domain